MDDAQRARDFLLAIAVGSAGAVEEAPWGVAVRNPEFPVSHAHNQLWVRRPVPAPVLLAEADRVLGDLGHRQLTVLDDETGRELAPALRQAGYVHARHVVMVAEEPPPAPRVQPETVSFADVRAPMAASWRREIPGLSAEGVRQLVERTQSVARACRLTLLGVRRAGAVVAWCELYRRGGTAQIEDVMTLPEWRGRGFASSLVATASTRAREAGDDLLFLVADEDDWPRELYRRLGFRERARTHVFARPAA
jgi:ribosomal protein S18 acetylase RimI-like enzyme